MAFDAAAALARFEKKMHEQQLADAAAWAAQRQPEPGRPQSALTRAKLAEIGRHREARKVDLAAAHPLRRARIEAEYTIPVLAGIAGVGASTVADIECGRSDGSPRTWQRLSVALRRPVRELR